jgi:hypothetical protein
MKLAWGAKVSEEFRDRVLQICRDFKWSSEHASWLMACIAFETGSTFSASIRNAAGSGATGLIQFMPKTARSLGTTTEELALMSEVERLWYVQEYLRPYYHRIKSLSDMYMAILAPIAIGRPDDSPLYSTGTAYRLNAPLDGNNDGVITKLEATRFVMSRYEKGMAYGFWAEVEWDEGRAEMFSVIARIKTDLDTLTQMLSIRR